MRVFTRNKVIGLVGVLVVGSIFVLVQRRRGNEAWQEMLETGAELEHAIASYDGQRAVLYGEALEGRAHPQYVLAIEMLSEGFAEEWSAYNAEREQHGESSDSLRDALVSANSEALAALSTGAHFSQAGFDLDWESEEIMRIPRMINARNLVNLSVMAAGKHLDNEEYELATNALLDAMQVAGDHMRCPMLIGQMIGCSLLNVASTEALIDQGMLGRMPSEQLERLVLGMDQLSLELPSMKAAVETEMAWFIRHTSVLFDQVPILPWWSMGAGPRVGFRYWFSGKLMCAEYVREALAFQNSQAGEGDRNWNDWNADFEAHSARVADLGNPLCGIVGLHRRSIELSRRSSLTRFNMARLAVGYRLTGETESMPDLFGDQLLVSTEDAYLLIESVGSGERAANLEGLSIQIGI